MGFSTHYISLGTIITREIAEISAYSPNLNVDTWEGKSILNVLKHLTGKRKFNISELSCEESDHETPEYFIKGSKGFVTLTLK